MKRKKLIIIGAGNVGGYISYNIGDFGDYDVIGFLDDDKKKHGETVYGHKVLGAVELLNRYNSRSPVSVVIGIANPLIREMIAKSLTNKNFCFPNFIARNAWISPGVTLGKGVIIYPGVSINYECVLEDFVIVNMNCAIGHNCTVSSYSTMAPGVNLGGFTVIGESADICIGVSTRQGICIGQRTLVGGQAMVVKNVPSHVKVKGIPASIYETKPPYVPLKVTYPKELESLTFSQSNGVNNTIF